MVIYVFVRSVLFYDNLIFKSKNLEIPHPRLHLRNFTLRPLLELEKSYSHPKLKKSIEELAKDSADTLKVSIFAGSEVALFK